MKITSLRQSEAWSEYLESLGWESYLTDFDLRIEFLRTFLGYVTKIQKPDPLNRKQLQELENICRKQKALFIKIEPGQGQDETLLEELGYKSSLFPLSPPKTLVIDLKKSEEDLWRDLSRSAKYSVNRARREGSVVRFVTYPKDLKLIEELHDIIKSTGKRGKFYTQPISDLKSKISSFKDKSYYSEVRNKEGELESAKIHFAAGDTVTYIHGGTTEVGRKSKGGYLMMWEAILFFKKEGYKYLDLEGLDDERFPKFTKNWGGFSHFKEKFGGFTIIYPPPYVKYLNPILRFLSKIQRLPF